MIKLANEFPVYSWETNVGYPTEAHRDGIRQWGISPFHRKSFTLLPQQLELFEE
jgi:ribonuclease HII